MEDRYKLSSLPLLTKEKITSLWGEVSAFTIQAITREKKSQRKLCEVRLENAAWPPTKHKGTSQRSLSTSDTAI